MDVVFDWINKGCAAGSCEPEPELRFGDEEDEGTTFTPPPPQSCSAESLVAVASREILSKGSVALEKSAEGMVKLITHAAHSIAQAAVPQDPPAEWNQPSHENCIDYLALHEQGDRYYLTHKLPFPPPPVALVVRRRAQPDLLPAATALYHGIRRGVRLMQQWWKQVRHETEEADNYLFDQRVYHPPREVPVRRSAESLWEDTPRHNKIPTPPSPPLHPPSRSSSSSGYEDKQHWTDKPAQWTDKPAQWTDKPTPWTDKWSRPDMSKCVSLTGLWHPHDGQNQAPPGYQPAQSPGYQPAQSPGYQPQSPGPQSPALQQPQYPEHMLAHRKFELKDTTTQPHPAWMTPAERRLAQQGNSAVSQIGRPPPRQPRSPAGIEPWTNGVPTNGPPVPNEFRQIWWNGDGPTPMNIDKRCMDLEHLRSPVPPFGPTIQVHASVPS